MRRGRGMAVLLLAITFVVGGLAGMAVEESTGIDWFEFLDDDNEDGAELMTGIALSAEQREKIDDIIDRQEDELEDYWESRMPEIRSVLDGTYGEIRALLDSSQQAQFDRKVATLGGSIPVEFRD